MSETVIDKLVVTLGLDPSGYKKGQAEANKSLNAARKNVTDTADAMSKSITSAARQFALAFLGFETSTGLVHVLSNLSSMVQNLGFVSTATGESAADLKNWSNAAEAAGSSADGFNATLQMIQGKINAFRMTGDNSDELFKVLGAFKIPLQDNNGQFKSNLTLLKELMAALDDYGDAQGKANENSLGLRTGISQDTMNFINQGKAIRDSLVEEQRKHMLQLTPSQVAAQNKLHRTLTVAKQTWQDLMLRMLTDLTPLISDLATKFKAWSTTFDTKAFAASITTAIDTLVGVVKDFTTDVQALKDFFSFGSNKEATGASGSSFKKMMDALDKDPFLSKLYSLGKSPVVYGMTHGVKMNDSIKQVVNELGFTSGDEKLNAIDILTRSTGKKENEKLEYGDYDKIQKSVNDILSRRVNGESNILKGSPQAMNFATGSGASARFASNSNSSHVTNSTDIGSITIHTSATDANGIAGSIQAAVRRKLIIGNANGAFA